VVKADARGTSSFRFASSISTNMSSEERSRARSTSCPSRTEICRDYPDGSRCLQFKRKPKTPKQ